MSDKHKSKVERRYSDFVHLQQQLLMRYSNRMIPKLPPKQLMMDVFLEERRCGLQRWLRLMSHHPLFSDDELFKCFLTDTGPDYLSIMQEQFSKDPDEFYHLPATAKLSTDDIEELVKNRELMRIMLNRVVKMKRLMEQQAKREMNQSKDFTELALVLSSIRRDANDNSFEDFSNSFEEISKDSERASVNQQRAVAERLEMVIEILTAHSDMCDRVEKRITNDHQALSKSLQINKEKIRNVIRGSSAADLKAISEKQQNELEALGRRNAFGIFCVIQETKFAQKYLKLLPSILLQFSHEEAKAFTSISEIFNKIVQKESDKLN